jgi:hypothetical protein
MPSRKGLASAVFVPAVVGFIGLWNLMQGPRFAGFHNVDVLQLIASGMCFGVALSAIFAMLRGPRAS